MSRPRHQEYSLLDGRRISLPPPIRKEVEDDFCCNGDCMQGRRCPRRREARRQAANKAAFLLVVLLLTILLTLGVLLAFRR